MLLDVVADALVEGRYDDVELLCILAVAVDVEEVEMDVVEAEDVVCFNVDVGEYANADAYEIVELTPVLRAVVLNLLNGDCGETGVNMDALPALGGVGDHDNEMFSSSSFSLSLPLFRP